MSDENYCAMAQQLIVEGFGQYTLVKLLSGQWASVWTACFDDERYCESILTESFFNDNNPKYPTKNDALKKIVSLLQDESIPEGSNQKEFNKPHLYRALKMLKSSYTTDFGVSREMRSSKAPDAWRDIFILNTKDGRFYFVPCQSVALVEVTSNVWIFRTSFGDFMLSEKGSALDFIMEGKREFDVRATTLELELLCR